MGPDSSTSGVEYLQCTQSSTYTERVSAICRVGARFIGDVRHHCGEVSILILAMLTTNMVDLLLYNGIASLRCILRNAHLEVGVSIAKSPTSKS